MTRSRVAGELERLAHQLSRINAIAGGIRIAMRLGGLIGAESAQAIAQESLGVAMAISRHDAFLFAELDAENAPPDAAPAGETAMPHVSHEPHWRDEHEDNGSSSRECDWADAVRDAGRVLNLNATEKTK